MPNDRICESDDNGFDNSDWCNNEKFDDSSLSAVDTMFSAVYSVNKIIFEFVSDIYCK